MNSIPCFIASRNLWLRDFMCIRYDIFHVTHVTAIVHMYWPQSIKLAQHVDSVTSCESFSALQFRTAGDLTSPRPSVT